MKLIELTRIQFDEFSKNHKYTSFYQTSAYGTLMSHQGFSDFYLGLVDEFNTILCASLFIRETKKSAVGTLNYAYAPRGFLIDYNNLELLKTFTKLLKKFLFKKGVAFVRLDPPLIYKEHNKKGEVIPNGIDNSNIIVLMQSLGYEHLGFNMYFETLKPRWNAIIDNATNSKKLFSSFNKDVKNKIRRSQKVGIEIIKSDRNSIAHFYRFIESKHIRNLEYYTDLYDLLRGDIEFNVFFAKIDPMIYLTNAKQSFEREQINNMKVINMMHKYKNNESLVNQKMDSDRLLNIYKSDIVKASNMSINFPNGVLIGANAVITYNKEVYFLIDGYDKTLQNLPANHLLKWKIIENYINKGYTRFHLNGITGDFSKENAYHGLYTFKTGYNANVVEYVGEFDLIINAPIYQMYRSVPQLQQYLRKQ